MSPHNANKRRIRHTPPRVTLGSYRRGRLGSVSISKDETKMCRLKLCVFSGAPCGELKHWCRKREIFLWTEPSSFYILDAVTRAHKTELPRSLVWLALTHRYSFPLIKHLPAHTHHCRLCCQPSSPGVSGPSFTHRSFPPLVHYIKKLASPSSEMSLITSVSKLRRVFVPEEHLCNLKSQKDNRIFDSINPKSLFSFLEVLSSRIGTVGHLCYDP